MNNLTIIIPSRKNERQISFIQTAIESVRRQTIAKEFVIHFLVSVDKNCSLDPAASEYLGVSCIESDGASQAKALNAAIRQAHDGFIAFLEDDDQWMPAFLYFAMQNIMLCDFVSSTQAEFNESNNFIRVNYFPTPSGWFMPISTLKKVGQFNEDYRFHLDNEWLGRLSEAKLKRIHMVESNTLIQNIDARMVQSKLKNVLQFSGGFCNLTHHNSPAPLVRRLVHSNSGMANIARNKECLEISKMELRALRNRYGFIPW